MSWRHVPAALRIAVVLDLAVFAVRAVPPFHGDLSLWIQLAMTANAALMPWALAGIKQMQQ